MAYELWWMSARNTRTQPLLQPRGVGYEHYHAKPTFPRLVIFQEFLPSLMLLLGRYIYIYSGPQSPKLPRSIPNNVTSTKKGHRRLISRSQLQLFLGVLSLFILHYVLRVIVGQEIPHKKFKHIVWFVQTKLVSNVKTQRTFIKLIGTISNK